ncbi:MAG TPA: RNA polymerase sigma factor [Planctomycetota bacterium]|nr:RNA polymerase sigma factor [Planctomycetota bacterium]
MTVSGMGFDIALRRLAVERDEAAWAAVLTGVGDAMARLTQRITGDAASGDDAVQEALLLIRDHAGQFRGVGEAAARGWIMRVTASAALQLRRRAGRRHTHERAAMAAAALENGPTAQLERQETAALIRRELAELPEKHRLPLALHYLSELELPRVAAALGWPLGTVKTRLHRGLAQLRIRLARVGVALSVAALIAHL